MMVDVIGSCVLSGYELKYVWRDHDCEVLFSVWIVRFWLLETNDENGCLVVCYSVI
jgi:hypothetical protein